MKKIIAVLAVIMMFTVVLTACGKKDDDTATPDSVKSVSAPATGDSVPAPDPAKSPASIDADNSAEPETTVVTETTAKGSTLEKDKDDYIIEIDDSGEIVTIQDPEGKEIDVPDYLDTHYFVASNGKTYGNKDAKLQSDSDSGKGGSSSGSSGGSGSGSGGQSSSSKSEGSSSKSGEEEVPATSAKPPVKTDEYELPVI